MTTPIVTSKHLRLAPGQVKLAAPDIDPHIDSAGHQERIAGQAEPSHIENRRDLLVGYRYIDVFEGDHIAEIFGGPIKWTFHKCLQINPGSP